MKKTIIMLLILMLVASFTACEFGDGQLDHFKDETATQSETEAAEQQGNSAGEIVFEGLTVVDNDQCSIKITSIDANGLLGYTMNVELENKSADKNYMFYLESTVVNGIEGSALMAETVAAGKKANEEVSIWDNELEKNGITEYTDIQLTFRVYDSDEFGGDNVAYETVHVYPYGEDKAVTFVREDQPGDNVIVDNEYVKIIVTGYEKDDIWGYTANFYVVNKTDKSVMFSIDDTSINGYMADAIYAKTVSAGKSAFGSVTWSADDLSENGISTVEQIEMPIKVYDVNDLLADPYFDQTVTLNP